VNTAGYRIAEYRERIGQVKIGSDEVESPWPLSC
jgi:hypothetical protein